MKGIHVAVAMAAISLGMACTAKAQMGMDLFKKSGIGIAKYINPVVGKGEEYQTTRNDVKGETSHTMEMSVTAKEMVDGKDGYWMQTVMTDDKGKTTVFKALISKVDFQFHRMIMQTAGMQAMEMPFSPTAAQQQRMQDEMSDWHPVGTEMITVPAGTFACEHLHNDTDSADLWVSDKVVPFGMVKQVGKTETMILMKVLSDVPDRITGPVTRFDPQQMMQQRQIQRQQQKP